MQITRLTVENIRAIDHLELDLATPDGDPRRRVVLLGANGAGKTTVLDAIAHAFQTMDGSSDGLGAKVLGAGDVRDVPPSGDLPRSLRTGEIRASVTFLDRERRWLRTLRQNPPSSGDFVVRLGEAGAVLHGSGVAVEDAPSPSDLLEQWRQLEPSKHSSIRKYFGLLGAQDSLSIQPFFIAARSVLQEARPPCVLLAADRGVLELRDDLPVRDVINFDPRRGCLSKDRARFAPLAARLALAWNNERSDPGGATGRMWKVLDKYFPELPKPLHVDGLMFWLRNRDGRVVSLPSLSDGERAILLIFAEVAFRGPAQGVVLIDEIEQHLHPRWQRAVLEGLSALLPEAQIIVTSQSPYLAATAPDDVVKVGDWDRDGA